MAYLECLPPSTDSGCSTCGSTCLSARRFGLGEATIVITILFAIWIIALDTQAGVKHISGSLVEMSRSFGASQRDVYLKILLWAALPEILAGIRLGMIRGVKGVVIGQLLVSVVGYGELFELYSRNFLMERFWAMTILVFAFVILVSELNRVQFETRRFQFRSSPPGRPWKVGTTGFKLDAV
jgi:ABC-type nitrate/sulfonate/bicarbonate transport system permease component